LSDFSGRRAVVVLPAAILTESQIGGTDRARTETKILPPSLFSLHLEKFFQSSFSGAVGPV
jgi:hypothetical protein